MCASTRRMAHPRSTLTPMSDLLRVRHMSHKGRPAGRWALTWCPGCDSLHPFAIIGSDGSRPAGGKVWDWDGDEEAPTFSPRLLCRGTVHRCEGEHRPEVCTWATFGEGRRCYLNVHVVMGETDPIDGKRLLGHHTPHTQDPAYGDCHAFLRNGVWDFLNDSAHHLAGQQVPMVPLPDWLLRVEDERPPR